MSTDDARHIHDCRWVFALVGSKGPGHVQHHHPARSNQRPPNGLPMSQPAFIDPLVDRLIDLAFEEDLGAGGDITTRTTVPQTTRGKATVRAKEPLVLAGVDVFCRVFARLDPAVSLTVLKYDGQLLNKGDEVIIAEGPAWSLLIGERPALNFMMRLSGIATLTRQMVDAVAGTSANVVDTRKTTPGWRSLEKSRRPHWRRPQSPHRTL
jgi:hypothetical protein